MFGATAGDGGMSRSFLCLLLSSFNFSLDYLYYRYFGFHLLCSSERILSKHSRPAVSLVRGQDSLIDVSGRAPIYIGEDQAPGLTPAAPTKLHGKMSSIPVVAISLPSCNGCVSPGTVCLNLLVNLTHLFTLFLIKNLHILFPACGQTDHQSVCLLTSGRLFSDKADTALYGRWNDQNDPLGRQP